MFRNWADIWGEIWGDIWALEGDPVTTPAVKRSRGVRLTKKGRGVQA